MPWRPESPRLGNVHSQRSGAIQGGGVDSPLKVLVAVPMLALGGTKTTDSVQPTAPTPDAKATAAESLRFAFADHQEIIRGTDIKAEVMALLVAAVVTVLTLENGISTACFRGWLGVASVVFSLVTLGFVGLVLWPRSNPWHSIPLGAYKPSGVLYPPVKLGPGESVGSRAAAALTTDWVSELTYELQKLASIRAAKQCWYRCALVAAAIAVAAAAVRLFL